MFLRLQNYLTDWRDEGTVFFAIYRPAFANCFSMSHGHRGRAVLINANRYSPMNNVSASVLIKPDRLKRSGINLNECAYIEQLYLIILTIDWGYWKTNKKLVLHQNWIERRIKKKWINGTSEIIEKRIKPLGLQKKIVPKADFLENLYSRLANISTSIEYKSTYLPLHFHERIMISEALWHIVPTIDFEYKLRKILDRPFIERRVT